MTPLYVCGLLGWGWGGYVWSHCAVEVGEAIVVFLIECSSRSVEWSYSMAHRRIRAPCHQDGRGGSSCCRSLSSSLHAIYLWRPLLGEKKPTMTLCFPQKTLVFVKINGLYGWLCFLFENIVGLMDCYCTFVWLHLCWVYFEWLICIMQDHWIFIVKLLYQHYVFHIDLVICSMGLQSWILIWASYYWGLAKEVWTVARQVHDRLYSGFGVFHNM